MSMTIEEYQYDEMLSEVHGELVMKKAALEQCIYIFVEGESEESVFQILLEDEKCGVNFEGMGVVVANYNGIGNLKHALRLLSKTLSHERPVIVTYDDDLEGKVARKYIKGNNIYPFPIPHRPVVKYKNGESGGSFEEAFDSQCFIESCFSGKVIKDEFKVKKCNFVRVFDKEKPWISQLAKFITENGGRPDSINKVELAEDMATSCSQVPDTFLELARLIIELRDRYPVKHPEDVDMPFR